MIVLNNFSLKNYNTFGIDSQAAKFVTIQNTEDIKSVAAFTEKKYVLGSGSNILLPETIAGMVIKNALMGKRIIKEDNNNPFSLFNPLPLSSSSVSFILIIG